MILYVAKDGDGEVWVYGIQPTLEKDGNFCGENGQYFRLSVDQAAEFAALPAGECVPVEVRRV